MRVLTEQGIAVANPRLWGQAFFALWLGKDRGLQVEGLAVLRIILDILRNCAFRGSTEQHPDLNRLNYVDVRIIEGYLQALQQHERAQRALDSLAHMVKDAQDETNGHEFVSEGGEFWQALFETMRHMEPQRAVDPEHTVDLNLEAALQHQLGEFRQVAKRLLNFNLHYFGDLEKYRLWWLSQLILQDLSRFQSHIDFVNQRLDSRVENLHFIQTVRGDLLGAR